MNTPTAMDKAKTAAAGATKPMSIEDMIKQATQQLGKALPAHMNPERLTRIALTTLRLNPTLYQCEPMSFLAALFQSAQLGLEPNVNGESWIIPYNNKGIKVAQFQVGYLGWIKLFWNHQSSVSINMETICKNDDFTCDLGTNELHHKPNMFGERGEVIGYYAIAHMKNGGRTFKVMSKDEAMKFAQKFSKCYDQKTKEFYYGTPWREHFDAMAMKTVIKQLIKLLPKSVEIQNALAMDETVKLKLDTNMVEIPDTTDYKELPAQAVGALEEHKADESHKSAPGALPSGSSAPLSAVDVAIHEAKRELQKLFPAPRGKVTLGEQLYYDELGKLGCEHMTELKPLDREVFLRVLRTKLKDGQADSVRRG